MRNKILIGAIGTLACAGSFMLGYFISKKKHLPKKVRGEIYIDYIDNPKQPAIYLNALDPNIFKDTSGYIVLEVNHIRK